MSKKIQANANAKNGPGPVAREKYEAILKERVRQCIAAQEAKIEVQRTKALQSYLESNGLANTVQEYRAALDSSRHPMPKRRGNRSRFLAHR